MPGDKVFGTHPAGLSNAIDLFDGQVILLLENADSDHRVLKIQVFFLIAKQMELLSVRAYDTSRLSRNYISWPTLRSSVLKGTGGIQYARAVQSAIGTALEEPMPM